MAPKDDCSRVSHLRPEHATARSYSDWRVCGMDPRPPRHHRQGAYYRLCTDQLWRAEALFPCGSHRLQTDYAGGTSLNRPNISSCTPDCRRLRYPFRSAHRGRLRAASRRGAGLCSDMRRHSSAGELLALRPARLTRTSRTGTSRSPAGTRVTPPLEPRHKPSAVGHFPRRCRMRVPWRISRSPRFDPGRNQGNHHAGRSTLQRAHLLH